MSNNQLINPLLSMVATIFMCAILSTSQSSSASTKQTGSYSSDRQQIRIIKHNGERSYRVDDKTSCLCIWLITIVKVNETLPSLTK